MKSAQDKLFEQMEKDDDEQSNFHTEAQINQS